MSQEFEWLNFFISQTELWSLVLEARQTITTVIGKKTELGSLILIEGKRTIKKTLKTQMRREITLSEVQVWWYHIKWWRKIWISMVIKVLEVTWLVLWHLIPCSYWQIHPTKPKHYCIVGTSIGLYVNEHKTEYMCYNQTGDISTLDGTTLKLVDKFTYLGSSVASNEKDIDTRLTKAWTAINRLSIIWKSDLTDKMKRSFFQAAVTSILLYDCTT